MCGGAVWGWLRCAMAGFPPGSAHGQPRLPKWTLMGSGRLSNSFFNSPGLQLPGTLKLLTCLRFLEQHAAWDSAEVGGCCNMPQPGGMADRGHRISLSKADLEGGVATPGEQPGGGGNQAPIGDKTVWSAIQREARLERGDLRLQAGDLAA